MTKQLVDLVFFHRSIRTNNTISTFDSNVVLRIVVFSESVLLVVVLTPRLYPSDTGFDQQEINNGYEDAWIGFNDPAPSSISYSHSERFTIPGGINCQVSQYSSQVGLVLVHSPYLVLPSRELLLQVAQHLYSTLLVVLKKDTLLRLQKEQFCSIFLILQTRVSPKTLLDLELYLSQVELEYQLTQELSTSRVLVFRHSLVLVSSDPVSIHQKELTYTSLVGYGYSDFKALLLSLRKQHSTSGWRTYSPRYRLHTSLWYRSEHWYRNRSLPNLEVLEERRRSWHCYHKVHS